MPKSRSQKQETLKNIIEQLKKAKLGVLVSFSKLSVSDDLELRSKMRKGAVDYEVIKKTLLSKSFEQADIKSNLDLKEVKGNIALAVSLDDEVMPAKLVDEFKKDKDDYQVLGGIFQGVWVDKEKILALAKLLSKQELIAKTIGSIKAPLSGFVNVLVGNIRGLVNVLNAIKEKSVSNQ